MPAPRATSSLRPQSPLSPRFDHTHRYDSMAPTPPRPLPPKALTGNSSRRPSSGSSSSSSSSSLKLPSLPRFHPANFPSQHSSPTGTPMTTGPNSPQPPLSPVQQQRLYSEAQKQLYLFQRETLAANGGFLPTRDGKPVSPRLMPLGSPGPVTPLELEGQGGYIVAGARAKGHRQSAADELVDKLIEQEALQNAANAAHHGTAVQSQ